MNFYLNNNSIEKIAGGLGFTDAKPVDQAAAVDEMLLEQRDIGLKQRFAAEVNQPDARKLSLVRAIAQGVAKHAGDAG